MKTNLTTLEKNFNDTFSLLSRSYSWSLTWEYFLKSCLLFMSFDKQSWKDEIKNALSKDERLQLGSMVQLWIQIMDIKITDDNTWYDFFGNFWEENILGKWERSGSGIFFTPKPICDLSSVINGASKKLTGQGLRISDPACGSGRMLLSFNSIAPGNLMFAQDINHTCALMTVCNFLIHGITGEIIHGNSLSMEFFNGWFVDWNRLKNGLAPVFQLKEYQTSQAIYEREHKLLSILGASKPSPKDSSSSYVPYDATISQNGQLKIF